MDLFIGISLGVLVCVIAYGLALLAVLPIFCRSPELKGNEDDGERKTYLVIFFDEKDKIYKYDIFTAHQSLNDNPVFESSSVIRIPNNWYFR